MFDDSQRNGRESISLNGLFSLDLLCSCGIVRSFAKHTYQYHESMLNTFHYVIPNACRPDIQDRMRKELANAVIAHCEGGILELPWIKLEEGLNE